MIKWMLVWFKYKDYVILKYIVEVNLMYFDRDIRKFKYFEVCKYVFGIFYRIDFLVIMGLIVIFFLLF